MRQQYQISGLTKNQAFDLLPENTFKVDNQDGTFIYILKLNKQELIDLIKKLPIKARCQKLDKIDRIE